MGLHTFFGSMDDGTTRKQGMLLLALRVLYRSRKRMVFDAVPDCLFLPVERKGRSSLAIESSRVLEIEFDM